MSDRLPLYGDGRRVSVGLLGGSFNPAHEGHLAVARRALRELGLDQVWLLVSPGNPLKPREGMGAFVHRLASARALADGRRIVATDIEQRLGQRFTVQTVAALRRRFPHVRFVWLMGADGLASLSRWRRWRRLARLVPIAVWPRPGYNRAALRGRAASCLRRGWVREERARELILHSGDAWTFLSGPQTGISATALRAQGKVLPS